MVKPANLSKLLNASSGSLPRRSFGAQWEKFYRTYYTPANLPEKKTARLAAKLNRPPELVVFEKVGDEGKCHECGAELLTGDYLLMDNCQPLCLTCADLDRLVFLAAGDTALSRRSRKHSSLAAVVVRFNRKRKQYERQGLLVTEEALAKAYRALNRGSAEQNWSSPPKAILELSRILLKFL